MSPTLPLLVLSYLATQVASLALPVPVPDPQATSNPTNTIYAYPANNGNDMAANALTQSKPDPTRYKPDDISCFPNDTNHFPTKLTYCQDLLFRYLPTVLKTGDIASYDPAKSSSYSWGDAYLNGDPKRCKLALYPLDSTNTTIATFKPEVFIDGAGFVATKCANGGFATLKAGTGGEKWAFNLTSELPPGQVPNPPDPTGTAIPLPTQSVNWNIDRR